MVTSVIYVEGGGDRGDLRRECRRAFSTFFGKTGLALPVFEWGRTVGERGWGKRRETGRLTRGPGRGKPFRGTFRGNWETVPNA